MNKMKNNIKQNREIITILIIAIILSVLLINCEKFIETYNTSGLNNALFSLFGVFLGCLVTAYTITIAFNNQIPKKVKDTKAYKRVNIHFLITLLTLVLLIVLNLSLYFINIKTILFLIIFLSIFSILMVCFLILIIFKLVSIINKN